MLLLPFPVARDLVACIRHGDAVRHTLNYSPWC